METRRPFRTWVLASLCAFFLASAGMVRGRTIYVDDDAGVAQDGSSWVNACRYLQDALALAQGGDEIRVAQGVYRPDQGAGVQAGDRYATFCLVDGLAVLGGFAGTTGADPNRRDPNLFATILTGDLRGDDDPNTPLPFCSDNSFTIVTAGAGRSTLDGVTVTRAVANNRGGGVSCAKGDFTARHCTFLENYARGEGAGLYDLLGTVRLEDCRFLRNESSWCGGGLANMFGMVEAIACEFIDNYAQEGGGMYNYFGGARLENCRFLRNESRRAAGGLANRTGRAEVIDCEFIDNHAQETGGGVYHEACSAIFFHCLFRGNSAREGAGAIRSAGVLSLLHCTFADNRGHEDAGAVACHAYNAKIVCCLFYRNSAVSEGAIFVGGDSHVSIGYSTLYGNFTTYGPAGGIHCQPSYDDSPTKHVPAGTLGAWNCIFWDNHTLQSVLDGRVLSYPVQINAEPNAAAVEYCCVSGWTPEYGGTGNLGADPLFVAPDQNDLHLKSQAGHWDAASLTWATDEVTSPCIDAGSPDALAEHEPFPHGGRANMGAYGGTCEASKSWFGVGPSPAPQAADLNGDGRVDAEDYRLATLRWPPVYE